tara:strand:- start:930 stop:1187 length:258 start_codon:yes stop_codon:yes gene_type:complete
MSNITLTTKQRSKIKRAIKSLNDVRQELQNENGDCEVQWYLEDSDNLNLMSGESHEFSPDTVDDDSRQDRVIDTFYLEMSSGGGW